MFFVSSRRRHTRCALVTGVQTCALPIYDTGSTSESAQSSLDIVNYDVRESIAAAERAAARSSDPAATFSRELSNRILGNDGIRNRYLQEADNGRATFDITGPLTSLARSAHRLVGQEGVTTWRSRWSPDHYTTKHNKQK